MPVAALAIIQWIGIGQQIIASGSGLYSQIMGILRANGIQADTSALDEVIADADRRKAIAEAEARG